MKFQCDRIKCHNEAQTLVEHEETRLLWRFCGDCAEEKLKEHEKLHEVEHD